MSKKLKELRNGIRETLTIKDLRDFLNNIDKKYDEFPIIGVVTDIHGNGEGTPMNEMNFYDETEDDGLQGLELGHYVFNDTEITPELVFNLHKMDNESRNGSNKMGIYTNIAYECLFDDGMRIVDELISEYNSKLLSTN